MNGLPDFEQSYHSWDQKVLSHDILTLVQSKIQLGFPSGIVIKSLPANAG